MKRAIALLFVSVLPLGAQPEAAPANPPLQVDAAADFFARARNVYDSAQAATDREAKRGLYDRSAELFTQYVGAYPNHSNTEMAWWYLGNSHYQTGRAHEAKRAFNMLINRYGDGKWAAAASYTLAADAYNKSDFATAAPLFDRYAARADKPAERARGNYLAGVSYQAISRDAQAIAAFQRVENDPAAGSSRDQAIVALGHYSLKSGKLQDALARFQQVAENESVDPKVRGEAALHGSLTATKLGNTKLAGTMLDLILRTPGMEEFRPNAETSLMANLFAAKQYNKVVEIFKSGGAQGTGEEATARTMIAARSYMRLKQADQALTLFREVEKLAPPQSDTAFKAAYYRLLCFYQIEGKHVPEQVDAFLQLYRKSRGDDPRTQTALLMKAESLFSAGETAEAAKVFTQINAAALSAKNRPGLYYQRGWCLAEAGDNPGAIRSLTEFISASPDDPRVPTALAKRAKAYTATGENDKAIADFDKLAKTANESELVSFAWLESARLRRSTGDIPDMIVRYKGLLKNVKSLDDAFAAEANYWIGWGHVKQNTAGGSVSYLEKARQLRPKTFGKHAGILLALGYFAAQAPEPLADEIELAIKEDYVDEIPDQTLQWSGMQSFNARKFEAAAACLTEIATPDDPRSTPKEVWRYLAKSLLETGKNEKALKAADHVLAVEDSPAWKANALLDRGLALAALNRNADARKSVDEAIDLHPQDRTNTRLRLLSGDLFGTTGDQRKAAGEYLIVVKFHDDREFRPLALSKLADTFDQLGDKAEAEKYRAKLAAEYPDWKKP
ncbi:MAG: tetratricopeptide repeat protein [Verrucomicrobiota bacterium]